MLFNHYFDYSNAEIMFNRLRDSSDEKNKNMVELSNNKLTKLKYIVRNCLKMTIELKRIKK